MRRGQRLTKAERILRALQRGCSPEQAAKGADCTLRYARQVGARAGLYTPKRTGRPRTPLLREAIRRGYAEQLTPPEIVARLKAEHGLDTTVGSVRALASKMKISQGCGPAAEQRATRHRGGVAIPPELRADYLLLQRKGRYRAREAAAILGLLVDA